MAASWLVKSAYAASGMALLALTGCGGGSPDERYDGPSASSYEQPSTQSELAGGPSNGSSPGSTLAGGPRQPASMQPIPNPEDLPLEERRRIYGPKYDNVIYRPKAQGSAGHHNGPPLRSWRDESGKMVVAMRPIANPEDLSAAERKRVYGNRYAPRAHSGSSGRRPVVAAAPKPTTGPTPRPVTQAPAARPAAKPVASPAVVAQAAPAPKPSTPTPIAPPVKAAAPAAPSPTSVAPPVSPADAKLAALSAAVGPEVLGGAKLSVPEALSKGEESKVTLSMPANLLAIIQREAAKLGLAKPARKAEVSATLAGQGYDVTPNAAQTQVLKPGEAVTFNWQVKPTEGEKAPLKATVDGALTGSKSSPQAFSLMALEQEIAKVVDTTVSDAKKLGLPSLDKLAIPGLKPIKIGDTTIPPGATTAGLVAFIIGLILLALARGAASRKAREERRRKFRTMTDHGTNEPDTVPTPPATPAINPLLAASGGFAAGAVAVTAVEAADQSVTDAPETAPPTDPAPVYSEPVSMTFAPSQPAGMTEIADREVPPMPFEPFPYNPEVAPPADHRFVAYPGDAHVEPAQAARESQPEHA